MPIDPCVAIANMLRTNSPEEQVKRVSGHNRVAILALQVRTAADDAERAAHVEALTSTVEGLTWMVGTNPLPGAPR